jgi:ribokinase
VSAPDWIAVVGSLNADVTVRVGSIPGEGETVLAAGAAVFAGGKGANQALQAARLGARVRMVGRVGRDPLGELVVGSLTAAGVDIGGVAADGKETTGLATILIERSGTNRIVVAPGANERLSPEDVERCGDLIAGARLLLCQLEVPLETVERAVALAALGSVPVLLNPAPARPLPPSLLERVTWLVPNEHEAMALAGGAGDGIEAARDAARALRALGPSVVITLGAAGAIVVTVDGEQAVPAVPVDDVVDTTAAGDAFCGALAFSLSRGSGLLEAVRLGNAAGAFAVTGAGAQPSLGTLADVEAMLSRASSEGS